MNTPLPLKITFGDIECGCAEMVCETAHGRTEVHVSFFTDPFADLACLALAMLRGEPEAGMRFTDEPGDYRLTARLGQAGYTLRLERWTDYFSHPPEVNALEEVLFDVDGVAAGEFALELCVELRRIAPMEGVRRWFLSSGDDDEPLHDDEERAASLAELETELMR